MKQFQQELATLKQRVVEMGELAESMVAGASDALINAERAASSRCSRTNRSSIVFRSRSTAKRSG